MKNNKFNLLRFIIGTIIVFFTLIFTSLGIFSPLLFISSFLIAPIIVYFFNKHINLKSKNYYLGLIAIFFSAFIFSFVACTELDDRSINTNTRVVKEVEEESTKESSTTTVEDIDIDVIEEFTEATVHFINTGNSDAILILQDDKSVLVDAGDNDDQELIVDYLNNLKISKIDYLVSTHPDSDHCGGLDTVLDNFKITKFLVGNGNSDTSSYTDVINSASNKGINPSIPLENEKFNLTNNSYIQFFNTTGGSDSNESSLVTLFVNGEDKFLLTGDAGEETENKILSKMQDIDVLKVGHHGSKNGTSQEFLDKVTPEYAVILTGKNSYGHPHSEVLTKLESANIKLHRSDECGDIIFKSTGEGVSTNCTSATYLANDKDSREEAEKIAEEQRLAEEKRVTEQKRIEEEKRIATEKAEQERIAAEQAKLAQEAEAARQAEEAKKAQEASQQNNVSQMVWLSATGEKYHRINNCGRMNPNKARQVTLAEAQARYEACKNCW